MKKILSLSLLALLFINYACEGVDPDEVKEGLEELNRLSDPTKYDQGISDEASNELARLLPNEIATFAMHPDGGWVIVTKTGQKFARNIPTECDSILEQFLADGHQIRCVAFPTLGGNRWVILTDKAKFARNIPDACNDKLDQYYNAGTEVYSVAFSWEAPQDDSWVILTENGSSARNIDDECFQILKNLEQEANPGEGPSRPVHFVAFDPDGNGWAVLAEDYYFTRNISNDCFAQLGVHYQAKRENAIVAFDPDRQGFAIVANERYKTRLPKDEIETFEGDFGFQTIWSRMRDTFNVPGVSVAVVIDNELAWSTAYGHIKAGEKAAVHPNTIFQAASISKVFAAIGAHQMVDDGLISLNSDIQQSLSVNIPHRACLGATAPPIILRDVLNHTSPVNGHDTTFPTDSCQGFPVDSYGGGYAGYHKDTQLPSLAQIIAGTGTTNSEPITLSHPQGNRSYSGPAMTLLEQLTQDLSGQSYVQWQVNRVLNPLNMNDSYMQINLPQTYFDKQLVAAGHKANGDVISGERRKYPEFAAAGLYSTVEDLSKLIIMLNNNGQFDNTTILSAASHNALVNQAIGVNTWDGGSATNAYVSHGGTNNGFRSLFLAFPSLNTGVVLMTNGDAGGTRFRREIAQAVVSAYGW
ncbi:MAG: serine hydrolase domain-containing protein [Bacteroidota bacterium]